MAKEAIGKGRAAIFDGLQPATSNQTTETSDQKPATGHQQLESSNLQPDTSKQPEIDEDTLAQALAEAEKSPKITIFSPMVAAVLRYKQLTTIRYSFSTEARERLEQSVKEAYPDLWEAVDKAVAKK